MRPRAIKGKDKGDTVRYVLVNVEDKSRGADVFDYTQALIHRDSGRTIGFVLEENLYLLDLDATVPQGKFVADYIIGQYPDIICFKTPKAGGYHFLFKSPANIKCGVGFMTIFGFPIDIKKARGHAILPDNFPGRSYVNGCKNLETFNEVMQDYNVFLTPQELRDLIPYGKDVKNPVDLTSLVQGERNETIFRWLARWGRGRGVTQLENYAKVISQISGFSYKEIQNSIKSIHRYMDEDNEPIEEEEIEGLILGKNLLDLAINVVDYIKRSGLMSYDICTGNYTCSLRLADKNLMSQVDMYNYFRLYFKDKVRYWYKNEEGKTVLKPVSELDLKNIFELVTKQCTYNSRLKVYEEIPKWDGIPRINTFLKLYMDCNAKPEFFLLLMTALVGKLKEPDKCYVPFFFDMCGNKGCLRGKTPISIKKENGRVCTKTLKTLFKMQQSGERFFIKTLNEETHTLEYTIGRVVYNGRKPTYKVSFENGKSVSGTKDHMFYTQNGWKELKDLTIGDDVLTKTITKNKQQRTDVKEIFVMYHPSAALKQIYDKKIGKVYSYFRVPEHRAIYEAHKNNMTLDEYKDALNDLTGTRSQNMWFIPDGMCVHHKNHDYHDNRIENLELMSTIEHDRLHGKQRKTLYCDEYTKVVGIKRCYGNSNIGTTEQDVYDINCVGNHNYFANGVLVHNCGKTLLFKRLMGEKFMTTIVPSQREDDICTNIYSKGALIALDDECLLTQGKGFSVWTEDKLKAFVTQSEDVFARKFQNVEYHPRGFVLCRTSNFVKSATDTDERRQIIFESNLPPRECRIKPDRLSDRYFEQMRAEAKEYYEKNGLYQLKPEDWRAIEIQQSEYVDDENIFISETKEYLFEVFNHIKLNDNKYYSNLIMRPEETVVTWETYRKWVMDKNAYGKPMSGALFWKNIRSIGQKTGIVKPLMGRLSVFGIGQASAAAVYVKEYDRLVDGKKIAPIPKDKYDESIDEDEIPDMEY